jgi:hypothetical protein
MSTRDASLGAGLESGLSKKEKIGGTKGVIPNNSRPEQIKGAWPKSGTSKAARGHTFKG